MSKIFPYSVIVFPCRVEPIAHDSSAQSLFGVRGDSMLISWAAQICPRPRHLLNVICFSHMQTAHIFKSSDAMIYKT